LIQIRSFFGKVWDAIIGYSRIIGDFIIILIWVRALMFPLGFIFSGDIFKTVNFIIALSFFFIAQMIVILWIGEPGSILSPFTAFGNFFVSLQYLIPPVAKAIESVVGDSGLINQTIDNVNNMTKNITSNLSNYSS